MNLHLKNKKVLVTGGSRGLGKALVESFAKEGAQVGFVARSEQNLQTLYERLPGNNHAYFIADLMDDNQLDACINFFNEKFNYFDIIVHNIGGSLNRKDVFCSKEEWIDVLKFNLGISIDINNFFIPLMQEKKYGRVIHISSISGQHLLGDPTYAFAKNSINAYVKIISRKVASDDVIVSSLLPGAFMFEGSYWDNVKKDDSEKYNNFIQNHLSIGRLGEVDEIVNFVLFMSSIRASFAAGSLINLDGGTI